jgi:hypothetical protein
MSDREFENYLTIISRLLRLSRGQEQAIGEELRDHFESRMAELIARGVARDDAVRSALEEFGDAAGLAAQFSSISQTRKRRLIMRCTVASVTALAAALVVAMAVWPENHAGRMISKAAAQSKEKPDDSAGEKARQLLGDSTDAEVLDAETDAKLNHFIAADYQEVPLKDFMENIGEKFDVQVIFDNEAMKTASIDPSVLVITVNLHHVRGSMLLHMVLGQFQMSYMVEDGILVVSTREKLDTHLVTRVYDCRKLLADDTDPYGPLAIGGEAGHFGPPATDATSKPGEATAKPVEAAAKSAEAKPPVSRLVKLICNTIEPPTWSDEGGPGELVEYRGLLVVSQTNQVQKEVDDFLAVLSKHLVSKPKETSMK